MQPGFMHRASLRKAVSNAAFQNRRGQCLRGQCQRGQCPHGRSGAALDVSISSDLDASDVPAMLEQHGLLVRDRVSLGPDMWLGQRHFPLVAGIYVYPSSAPLHVAHRRIGARTQSRAELVPGSCMLRGEKARHEWTLAIPPLLVARAVALGATPHFTSRERQWSERTRKFALLADIDGEEEDFVYEFETYRARANPGEDEDAG